MRSYCALQTGCILPLHLHPLGTRPGQTTSGHIAALTGELAARGLPIRDGRLVGKDTFTRYDDGPRTMPTSR
jgi:hypothetical protein